MKQILGLLLIISGILLGLYVGFYVCLFGGVMSIIEGAKATPVEAASIAWGVVKIVAAGLCGWFSAVVPITIGAAMMRD